MLLLWLFDIYSDPTVTRHPNNCNVFHCTTTKYLNLFIHFLTYLPKWITKFSSKIQLKTFFVANYCFHPSSIKQEPQKTATRQPVERSFRNQGVRHIFCKRPPPPSSHKLACVHWGYKFLWISAVLPVSWATVLRFNWVRTEDLRSKAFIKILHLCWLLWTFD